MFVVRAHTKADAIALVARHKLTEIHAQDLLEIGRAKKVESGKEGRAVQLGGLSQNDKPPLPPVNTQKEIAKAAGVSTESQPEWVDYIATATQAPGWQKVFKMKKTTKLLTAMGVTKLPALPYESPLGFHVPQFQP